MTSERRAPARFRATDLPSFSVMGILNVTPDSFSDGGRYLDHSAAVRHGQALADDGADVIDVGGESTRPGAAAVDAAEEARRVVTVIEELARSTNAALSVDTRKAAVAAAAIDAGAALVNDVSGGRADPEILGAVADRRAGLVVMHMQGTPETMQDDPRYDDVVDDVSESLVTSLEAARRAGIDADALFADPGIGFGKTAAHNLELLGALPTLSERVGVPLVVGASRKRFLAAYSRSGGAHDVHWTTSSRRSVGAPTVPVTPGASGERHERDDATLATSVWAFARGVRMVRVHDVADSAAAARVMHSAGSVAS